MVSCEGHIWIIAPPPLKVRSFVLSSLRSFAILFSRLRSFDSCFIASLLLPIVSLLSFLAFRSKERSFERCEVAKAKLRSCEGKASMLRSSEGEGVILLSLLRRYILISLLLYLLQLISHTLCHRFFGPLLPGRIER